MASTAGLLHRTLVKTIALRVPIRCPTVFRAAPKPTRKAAARVPVDLASDKRELVEIIRRFVDRKHKSRFGVRPGFGAISEWEWMRRGYIHADHPLRQFGL